MPRLIRTIASLTVALGSMATTALAGDNGSPGRSEAPPVAQPTGSAPPGTPVQPPTGPANPPSQGTPAIVLDTQDYDGLLGKSVRAANGDDLGRIIDVIIDRDGRPRAAIIDFGGFLGVGSRKIAVDWRVLKFTTEGKVGRITLALNRNQVRVSPEYKTGEPIVVLGASASPPPEGDPAAVQTPLDRAPQDKAAVSDKPGAPDKAPEKPEKTPER